MRAVLRSASILLLAFALTLLASAPAFAQTTCACDNGQSVESTSSAPDACANDCQLVGANGGVPAPADYDDGDDDGGYGNTEVVVPPRRDVGPEGRRRR
jgi:hypothetical protein